MGNKHNVPSAPARAHSTTTPPTAGFSNNTTATHQQQSHGGHHRINRRRSEFQQSRRNCQQNSDNLQQAMGNNMASNSLGNNSLTPGPGVSFHPSANQQSSPSESAASAAERERMRQNRRRWSSIASVNPRAGGGTQQVVKPKRITPRQCHLVIKSWSRRAPKSRVVKDIFAAIFTEAEELRAAFGIETSSMGKRLRTDANFVAHTNMFTDTLDFVIRNLDDLALVTENAEQLGRRHASFPLEHGFRPEYWNIFTECIVEGVSAGEEDKETHIAWRQLVQTIVYYMKLGYDRETLRITRHSSFRRSNSPMAAARVAALQHERHSPSGLENGMGRSYPECRRNNLNANWQ